MAITKNLVVTLKNDVAKPKEKMFVYRDDVGIEMIIELKDFNYSIDAVENRNNIRKAYALFRTPANKTYRYTNIKILNGKLVFTFSQDIVNVMQEIGEYELQFQLYDKENNRLTIPSYNFYVKEPLTIDGELVDMAVVDESRIVDFGEEQDYVFVITDGYIKTEWKAGDLITKERLNKVEDALSVITDAVNSKAEISQLHNHENKEILDTISANKINEWDNKSNFNGDYNNLTNKPTIPSLNGYATEQYVNEEIKKIDVTEQLTDYAKKSDLEVKADKSYVDSAIESVDVSSQLTNYATKSELSLKVDKVNGYSLVSDAEISKLATLENYDDSEVRELIDETNVSLDKSVTFKVVGEGTAVPPISGGSSNDYVLPIATKTTLGGVKIGNNLSIDSNGVLSVTTDVPIDLSVYAKKTDLHDHSNKTILDSITTSKVNQWDSKSDFSGNYNDLTNKPTIPTKVSELTNDKGYLTEYQDVSWDVIIEKPTTFKPSSHNHSINDISDYPNNLATKDYVDEAIDNAKLGGGDAQVDLSIYAKKTDLHDHSNKTILDSITTSKVNQWDNKSNFSGNYNDLTNKPTIPTKVSDLTNDVSYLTSIPDDYVTDSELNSKGYLTEHQDISGKLDKTHNTSSDSHSDIRLLIDGLTSRLNSLADSDDTTLDQLSEIANYIKNNKSLIDNVTTSKVNISDIIDNLTTNVTNKPLSAKQGVQLKTLIDTLTATINTKADKTELHSHSNKNVLDGITTDKITEWNNKSAFDGNYNNLTNKPTIPSKTSQLTNDKGYLTSIPSEYVTDSELNAKGYLTEHQDISGKVDKVNGKSLISDSEIERLSTLKNYDDTDIKNALNSKANKTDLHSHTNKTVLDGITSAKVNEWNNKSTFDGNYNNLTNKPNVPTKTSQLTNDSGFMTTVPSEYITETELNTKGYLTEHQDISGKVDKVNGCSLVSDAEISRLATLKNYDDTEIRESINEIDTSLDNIKNSIITNGINIANPPNNLLPCDMTGETDSTEKFKNILEYATNNYSHVKIVIPNGTILITDTIDIDVEKISIECDALILCNMSQGKYALRFGKTGTYDGRYNKGRTTYKGLFLRCANTYINLRSNAILFTGTMETAGSSNITFENCVIQDFNEGLTYADRSYFIRFNNSDLYGNVTQINIVGGVDTGENIKFTNCAIANGGTALECDNSLATVYFNGCSIDYNYNRIFNIKKGIVFVDNCHIEHSSSHFQGYVPFEMHSNDGNKCSITNSFILFAEGEGNNLEYIIKNNYIENAMSFFSVSSCFLQGWKTTSGYIGTGLINMHSNQCYQWNDQCYKLSDAMNKIRDGHFYDASLNSHKDFIKYKEPNNIEIFTKYSRTYEGDNWLAIKKLSNYQTNGSACFLVPRNMLCTLFGGEMRICANKSANIDVRFGLCRYINGEIVHEDLLYDMGQIKFGTEPIILNLTGRQLNRNNPSLDYIFMEVILYNCEKDTEIYLKDFSIYEF